MKVGTRVAGADRVLREGSARCCDTVPPPPPLFFRGGGRGGTIAGERARQEREAKFAAANEVQTNRRSRDIEHAPSLSRQLGWCLVVMRQPGFRLLALNRSAFSHANSKGRPILLFVVAWKKKRKTTAPSAKQVPAIVTHNR